MAYDPSYLGQNLTERTRKATHDFAVEMTQIASRMAGNGTLNSSMTFVQYWQAALRVLEREANEACKFVYNLTEQHTGEPYNQVEFCVRRMCENMMLNVSPVMPCFARRRSSISGTPATNGSRFSPTSGSSKTQVLQER